MKSLQLCSSYHFFGWKFIGWLGQSVIMSSDIDGKSQKCLRKSYMHARAKCASGKHVEIFAIITTRKLTNPLWFKWENDRSFPSIYRAGEFEVSKSKVIEIKSFQSMHYRTCHLSWECWRTYMYLKIVCKICGLFTMNKESLTEEQCEKWFEIHWC